MYKAPTLVKLLCTLSFFAASYAADDYEKERNSIKENLILLAGAGVSVATGYYVGKAIYTSYNAMPDQDYRKWLCKKMKDSFRAAKIAMMKSSCADKPDKKVYVDNAIRYTREADFCSDGLALTGSDLSRHKAATAFWESIKWGTATGMCTGIGYMALVILSI